MIDESRIMKLLEKVLETGRSPEDVCRDDSDLLDAVHRRLELLRQIDAQIEELFPTPGPNATSSFTRRAISTALPDIPGYDVERVLGHGGMGIVYLARHRRLNRLVAIKMLLAGAYASELDRTRFLREAEAVANFEHPNIVHVHDYGELDGRPYFTMELIEGGSLTQKLAGTPQPAREAAALMVTLAEAVQVAHDRGVVHRDLKPGNVLLTIDGTPKITDFGLAHRLDEEYALTLTDVRLGTPSYMAPEQATNRTSSIGPGADVYSLGAILYELLTGRPPFRAETASETERQLLEQDPVPPSRLNAKVPRDLETICLKCLRKEPRERYASAAELAADLKRFLKHEPIVARPIGRTQRFVRWMRRHPHETGLIASFLAIFVLIAVFGVREWNLVVTRRAEMVKWNDRLAFILQLEKEGRFTEARAILGRVPDAGFAELREQIDRAAADLDIVERLDAIRMNRGRFKPGGGFDYAKASEEYQIAFDEIGIGKVSHDPAVVAERIRASTIRSFLVAALDDWAACADAYPRKWILDVAKRVDPDPWRDRVRDQKNWANTNHLTELAEVVRVEEQPVNILVAMGTRWRRLGGDPIKFLLKVQRQYPNDFWANFELGHLFGSIDGEASIGFNRAALAVRPNAAPAHYNLGNGLEGVERWDEAAYHFARAFEHDPNHNWARRNLANALLQLGCLDEALSQYEATLAFDPRDAGARHGLRLVLIRLGRGEEARALWAEWLAHRAYAATHEDWDGYAELCLFLGNEAEYHRACAELLARFGTATDPHICERTGRACLLQPATEEVLGAATSLIDRALAADRTQHAEWAYPYFLVAKALAEYRAGKWDEAARILNGDVMDALPPAPQLIRAMALHRSGLHDESRQLFASAMSAMDWGIESAVSREAWMYHILRREAEALLQLDESALNSHSHH